MHAHSARHWVITLNLVILSPVHPLISPVPLLASARKIVLVAEHGAGALPQHRCSAVS